MARPEQEPPTALRRVQSEPNVPRMHVWPGRGTADGQAPDLAAPWTRHESVRQPRRIEDLGDPSDRDRADPQDPRLTRAIDDRGRRPAVCRAAVEDEVDSIAELREDLIRV